MCVQCGCLDPRNVAGNAAAWAEATQRQSETRLLARIEALETQVARLRSALSAAGIAVPEPPAPAPEKKLGDPSYRQPGVTW